LASFQNEGKAVDEEFGGMENELIESLSEMGSKKEIFKINPQRPNTIVCPNGTTLILPKNSIISPKGEIVEEEIVIEIEENFKIQDFIVSNLQTIHNERILPERLG